MERPDKREQIMRAAERLFTSRRFHEVTTDDIAKAAHVGKGTIYRYFKNKDDLVGQIANSGFDQFCDLLETHTPSDGPFEVRLRDAAIAISRFYERRRQWLRLMQVEDSRMHWLRGDARKQWGQHRQRLATAVGEILERGAAEGRVRRDIPAHVLASLFLGMLRTRARDLSDCLAQDRDLLLLMDFFCRGVSSVPSQCPSAQDPSEERSE